MMFSPHKFQVSNSATYDCGVLYIIVSRSNFGQIVILTQARTLNAIGNDTTQHRDQ